MKKYQIILADPPWPYDNKGVKYAVSKQYKTMSDEEIYNLPVNKLADENCVLFLWATYPKLIEALQTIKSWGFIYKTIAFQWIKISKEKKLFFGLGRWARGNTEPCLLATKGKPRRNRDDVSQLILAPLKCHSQKPPIVMHKIVELMGDLPRVELFSRTVVKGWDRFGDETISNIDFI